MVRFLGSAFLAAWLLTSSAVAQDPGKVIDQYVKAAGGAKALKGIQTLAIEGTFTDCEGKAGNYQLGTRLPTRL